MDTLLSTVRELQAKLITGARPLNRLIQNVILEPLAMELISGGVRPAETVNVRTRGDKLLVQRNHEPREDANGTAPFKKEDMSTGEA